MFKSEFILLAAQHIFESGGRVGPLAIRLYHKRVYGDILRLSSYRINKVLRADGWVWDRDLWSWRPKFGGQ